MSNISDYFPTNINFSAAMPSISMPSISMPSIPGIPSMSSITVPSMPSMSFPTMPSYSSLVSSATGVFCVQQEAQKKSWPQLRESVRNAHRRLYDVSSKVPFNINFRPIYDEASAEEEKKKKSIIGSRIYFLCWYNNSPETTLLYCDVIYDKEKQLEYDSVHSAPQSVTISSATTDNSHVVHSSSSTTMSDYGSGTSSFTNQSAAAATTTTMRTSFCASPTRPDLDPDSGNTWLSSDTEIRIEDDSELSESSTDNSNAQSFAQRRFRQQRRQIFDGEAVYYYEWKPLLESTFKKFRERGTPVPTTSVNKSGDQEKLQLERKRIMLSGITSYEFDEKSRRFVFSSSGSIFYFDDTGSPPYAPIRLETTINAAKLNPQMCPSNPDLIAYVCDGDVWVVNVKSGHEIRLTNTKFNDNRRVLSAGLPSFVIQEEFRRYVGFWWRPESHCSAGATVSGHSRNSSTSSTCEMTEDIDAKFEQCEILFEEVDETDVEIVKIPTWDGNVEEYRFPRPGNPNAISSLKLATFKLDLKTQQMSEPHIYTIPGLSSLYTLYPDYEYLVRVGFHSHDIMWVQLLNRKQKQLVLGLISISESFPPQILYTEDASPLWVNVTDVLHFIKRPADVQKDKLRPGSDLSFIWLSEKSGYRHIYYIKSQLVGCESEEKAPRRSHQQMSRSSGSHRRGHGGPNVKDSEESNPVKSQDHLSCPSSLKSRLISKRQITCGNWEVSSQDIWVDEAANLIYFVGLKESPLERHLYVMSLTEELNQGIKRLTESNYSHSTITFDSSFTIFANIQSNISIPPFGFINKILPPKNNLLPSSSSSSSSSRTRSSSSFHASPKRRSQNSKSESTSLRREVLPHLEKLGLFVTNILNNAMSCQPEVSMSALPMIVDQIDLLPGLSKPEVFTYPLKSTGELIYGLIFKPEFMESGVKYPCLLDIYGGPEIQVVTNSFRSVRLVRRHLLSSEGYVVCSFDCRGSRNRGTQFEAHIQSRMGQVEIADQVEVLQWLAENTGYIDMERVAIHGWSYGGYLSLMGIAQRPDIFKLAIAGAPVTNWTLYDSGYTERYMDTPFANQEGYAKGSVLHYVNQFPSEENRLLIIHGLMDENVHFLHTVELIQALIKARKPYQLQVYPFERHNIRNSSSCEHYEIVLLSYLQQHL